MEVGVNKINGLAVIQTLDDVDHALRLELIESQAGLLSDDLAGALGREDTQDLLHCVHCRGDPLIENLHASRETLVLLLLRLLLLLILCSAGPQSGTERSRQSKRGGGNFHTGSSGSAHDGQTAEEVEPCGDVIKTLRRCGGDCVECVAAVTRVTDVKDFLAHHPGALARRLVLCLQGLCDTQSPQGELGLQHFPHHDISRGLTLDKHAVEGESSLRDGCNVKVSSISVFASLLEDCNACRDGRGLGIRLSGHHLREKVRRGLGGGRGGGALHGIPALLGNCTKATGGDCRLVSVHGVKLHQFLLQDIPGARGELCDGHLGHRSRKEQHTAEKLHRSFLQVNR
mmetsp:Transcript_11723/g.22495  ORF Transcript_11723/g.22495 Transcript_11723/m.22495 type:complete len:343 (-) Transcript_11723:53-1081(-)